MKYAITVVLFIMQHIICSGKMVYVSPSGNDKNNGTVHTPLATVQKAQSLVNAGDTVYIRGGVYNITEDQLAKKEKIFAYYTYINKSGKPGARINYWSYPGERPVFNFKNVKPANYRIVGFQVMANWLHFKGIEVTGVEVTIPTHTESYCFYSWGNHNIFELLNLHDNQGTGLRHRGGGDNLFLNCDSYRNYNYTSEDHLGGNTDGFGCHPGKGGTGNIFKGCRSWFNSDDGYDVLGAEESVTFENCWAFYNGYSPEFKNLADGNGFKSGGYGEKSALELPNPVPRHTIRFCLAVGNKANGFYANHHIQGDNWFNNTAYKNNCNYNMLNRLLDNKTDVPGYMHVLKNNLGYKGRKELLNINKYSCTLANNYFDLGIDVTADDFISLDESLLTAPRKPNGDLPDNGFMRLKPNSKFVDKGMDIGFPFNGKAPDLGAFEVY